MEYKIKVSFERVFKVEADKQSEAEEKALNKAVEYLTDGTDYKEAVKCGLRSEEYKEPANWRQRAEEDARDLVENLSDTITEAVKDKKNKEDADLIFDAIDNEEDISGRALETADGCFIYRSTDAVIEALNCINRLSDYSDFKETDSGLWEGKEEAEDIINIKATFTLANAIGAKAEEIIREKIKNLLL